MMNRGAILYAYLPILTVSQVLNEPSAVYNRSREINGRSADYNRSIVKIDVLADSNLRKIKFISSFRIEPWDKLTNISTVFNREDSTQLIACRF